VAAFAGCHSGMIKRNLVPIFGVVTLGAFTRVMGVWRLVTSLAIIQAAMIEGDSFPVADDMTVGALTSVMIDRHIFYMATLALRPAGVVKADVCPISSIMAVSTGWAVMIFGRLVAILAFGGRAGVLAATMATVAGQLGVLST